MPNKRNAKSVAVDAFTDSLFFTITIIHLEYPQKFCRRSIVFKFSWKDCKSQEKVETMLMQNVFFLGGGGWGGANKMYFGHLKAANFLYLTYKNIHNTTIGGSQHKPLTAVVSFNAILVTQRHFLGKTVFLSIHQYNYFITLQISLFSDRSSLCVWCIDLVKLLPKYSKYQAATRSAHWKSS